MSLTTNELKELTNDVEAFIARMERWEDAEYYHLQNLAAGAMAGQIRYFNLVRAYGITNFIQPNQVPFPFIITEVGLDMEGTPENQLLIQEHTEVIIVKDNRSYCSIPSCALSPGSGLSMSQAGPAAGNVQDATTGTDNRMYSLAVPIAVVPQQNFEVILQTDGVAIVAAPVGVKILLRGLVAMRVI